jgi:hypothetical protein
MRVAFQLEHYLPASFGHVICKISLTGSDKQNESYTKNFLFSGL